MSTTSSTKQFRKQEWLKNILKEFSWIFGILIPLDQYTKYLAEMHLKDQPAIVFPFNLARLEYAENKGAFLSLGSTLPDSIRYWVFTIGVGALLVLMILASVLNPKTERSTRLCLLFIGAGGVGNLIDRAFRMDHAVVDFMNVGIGSLRTGIFNIADMVILGGVLVLAAKSFYGNQSGHHAGRQPSR